MNLKGYQEHIEHIGTTLEPDDDWMPVLFLEKDDEVAVIGLMMMENTETKDMCAFMMDKIIHITNPDSACFITTAWISKSLGRFEGASEDEVKEAYSKGYIPPPSKDPNRIEVVTALCMGSKGENDGEAFMIGYIQRYTDKPPIIKEWEVHDESDLKLTGRFADAIRNGFASVDKNGDLSRLSQLKGPLNGTSNT